MKFLDGQLSDMLNSKLKSEVRIAPRGISLKRVAREKRVTQELQLSLKTSDFPPEFPLKKTNSCPRHNSIKQNFANCVWKKILLFSYTSCFNTCFTC